MAEQMTRERTMDEIEAIADHYAASKRLERCQQAAEKSMGAVHWRVDEMSTYRIQAHLVATTQAIGSDSQEAKGFQRELARRGIVLCPSR